MVLLKLRQTQRKMPKKKLQESLEDYVKNSKPLMDKFYAKSIQGTAYLPGHEEENSESNDKKKDQD